MPHYLTIIFAVYPSRLDDGRNTRFCDIYLPCHAPDRASMKPYLVQCFLKDLEGLVLCHQGPRLLLNLPAGLLHNYHIAAVVGPKLSSPACYRYKLLEAVDRVRNSMRRLLGNCTPPSSRAQESSTTTPTRWYCHKCNSGPYNIATQSGCTDVISGRQCDHRRCNYCSKE